MYVKLYNRILYSSIANNRSLRHFFTDLLLCADPDGNVIMTREAIANTIRADLEEVDWGLAELQKPDPSSLSPEFEGKRIIPLEGHGYGWKIVNYQEYRDTKTAADLREATAERVRRHREKKAREKAGIAVTNGAEEERQAPLPARRKGKNVGKPLPGEQAYEKILESEGQEAADAFVDRMAQRPPEADAAPGPCSYCGASDHWRPDCPEIPKDIKAGKIPQSGPSPLDLPDAEVPEI